LSRSFDRRAFSCGLGLPAVSAVSAAAAAAVVVVVAAAVSTAATVAPTRAGVAGVGV
jgi:hypothetical protein